MTYDQYRTGLTFTAVRQMLAVEAAGVERREGRRMFVTRHTVLGRWRQIKLASWEAMQRSATRRHVVQQFPLGRE